MNLKLKEHFQKRKYKKKEKKMTHFLSQITRVKIEEWHKDHQPNLIKISGIYKEMKL